MSKAPRPSVLLIEYLDAAEHYLDKAADTAKRSGADLHFRMIEDALINVQEILELSATRAWEKKYPARAKKLRGYRDNPHDFDIPKGLSPAGRRAAEAIVKVARKEFGDDVSGGGCRAFYTPQEWAKRGEDYGQGAELIVVHDGGDLAPFFNYDYDVYRLMDAALNKVGTWAEPQTSWYTAIYKD